MDVRGREGVRLRLRTWQSKVVIKVVCYRFLSKVFVHSIEKKEYCLLEIFILFYKALSMLDGISLVCHI